MILKGFTVLNLILHSVSVSILLKNILNQIFLLLSLNAGANLLLSALHSQSNSEATSFSD